ncbi:hypothetical protein [Pseudomonas sp. BRG-100]|uniref:hypothetical protein n=1 Tax=Pseudomonas sp. BRG-100 TaxID=1524267 RepID=UPI0006ACDCE4|nr:hypothetical protein [Pseudomonas sp. BRG-100]
MIRIDSMWLATEQKDMRAGTETALARVIAVFGTAQPHCAYLFAKAHWLDAYQVSEKWLCVVDNSYGTTLLDSVIGS